MNTKEMFQAKTIIMAIATGLFACGFSACSSDDDGDGGGGGAKGTGVGVNTSKLTTEGGLLVKSIGNIHFYYDSQNRVNKILDYSYAYGENENSEETIDYSKNKYYISDGDYQEWNVSFNKDGYVTKINGTINISEDEGEGEYKEKSTGVLTFSYDGEGHITKMNSTYDGVIECDGETYKEKSTGSIVYTWSEGNLVKCSSKWDFRESGYLCNRETEEINITYSDLGNKYLQSPYYLFDFETDGMEPYLHATGLFGKGPKNLPYSATSSYKDIDYEDGEVVDSSNKSVWFKIYLNANGTISSEGTSNSPNGSSYNALTYNYVRAGEGGYEEAKTRSAISDNDAEAKIDLARSLFKKSRHSKRR